MPAYYNEIDPYAAQWLRNLIAAGHIADGIVDERSIEDVRPQDLDGFTQCHFFAGIGGWSLALRMAGWDDSRPVWTGSCPCQPFSTAGAQRGVSDERHLWPAFFHLITQRRPAIVFGEQVASAMGRGWLAAVRDDLEAVAYGVGAADMCAAGVGAPHIRQRLYWTASDAHRDGEHALSIDAEASRASQSADADGSRLSVAWQKPARPDGFQGWGMSPASHWWSAESGMGLVVYGVPNRMARIRATGNAIVPQQAAAFIEAAMEA